MKYQETKMILDDYEKWKKINKSKFSKIDYIHGISLTYNLSSDIYFAFLDLFWPEFIEYNGRVFVKDFFEKDQETIKNKLQSETIEYWTNFLLIDGLFKEDIGLEKFDFLIRSIGESWKAKLNKDFPDKIFKIHLVNNEEDVGVTFTQIK